MLWMGSAKWARSPKQRVAQNLTGLGPRRARLWAHVGAACTVQCGGTSARGVVIRIRRRMWCRGVLIRALRGRLRPNRGRPPESTLTRASVEPAPPNVPKRAHAPRQSACEERAPRDLRPLARAHRPPPMTPMPAVQRRSDLRAPKMGHKPKMMPEQKCGKMSQAMRQATSTDRGWRTRFATKWPESVPRRPKRMSKLKEETRHALRDKSSGSARAFRVPLFAAFAALSAAARPR